MAWLKSPHVAPPPARAVRLVRSTNTLFISERSRTTPPSHVPNPGTLWPPPAYREVEAGLAGVVHDGDGVRGRRGPDDQRRAPVVHAVVDAAVLVVAVVARLDDGAAHLLAQLGRWWS